MRILILSLAFIIAGNTVVAQSKLFHSIGATISYIYAHSETFPAGPNFPQKTNIDIAQTNFCYFLRYNLIEGEHGSLSAGLPLGIGIGIYDNTAGDNAGIGFSYDIPLVIDYNFGCKSTRASEQHIGGYVGAGFGYYSVLISGSKDADFKGNSYGPMGRAGIRFSSPSWNGEAVTVGAFYKKGLESTKFSTIGFNVLLDF